MNKKILCVDDEAVNLDFLEAVLVKEGYAVIKTCNSTEALDCLRKERIDLVIADIAMTRVNGFDLCKKIKQDEGLRNIPVVLIAGKAASDRSRGLLAGAEDFIEKPFQRDDILLKIRMIIKKADLRYRFYSACTCINLLNSLGEEFADKEKQIHCDFLSGIDIMAEKLISRNYGTTGGPKIILVGVLSEKNTMQWYHYELSGGIKRTLLALDIGWKLSLPERGSVKTLFYNEEEIENSELAPLLDELRDIDLTVSSIVSYFGDDICIFALNYGRFVDEYDALHLYRLVKQCLSLKTATLRVKELEDTILHIVRVLAQTSEAEEEENENYINRIAECSGRLADNLGLPELLVRTIRMYSPIYDVGKIYIPSYILKKPGRLTDDEVLEVQKHTLYGAKIFGDNRNFKIARNITLTHHERWDGTGYPCGLRGENIPIEGRILNIVDQYAALRTPRPYRTAYDHKEALGILTEGDGRTIPQHFDPKVLMAFQEAAGEFEEIYSKLNC